MPQSEMDPWRVICSFLFELSTYDIPEILDRADLRVNWSLNEKEDYSHNTRSRAYRPRVNAAYEALAGEDQLRAAFIVAAELIQRGMGEQLDQKLQQIGWRMQSNRLTPATAEVKELFFPDKSEHDAYVEIRKIIQRSQDVRAANEASGERGRT